jgi:hypothetical protein
MTYMIHGARGSGSSVVEPACAEIGVEYRVKERLLDALHVVGAIASPSQSSTHYISASEHIDTAVPPVGSGHGSPSGSHIIVHIV